MLKSRSIGFSQEVFRSTPSSTHPAASRGCRAQPNHRIRTPHRPGRQPFGPDRSNSPTSAQHHRSRSACPRSAGRRCIRPGHPSPQPRRHHPSGWLTGGIPPQRSPTLTVWISSVGTLIPHPADACHCRPRSRSVALHSSEPSPSSSGYSSAPCASSGSDCSSSS